MEILEIDVPEKFKEDFLKSLRREALKYALLSEERKKYSDAILWRGVYWDIEKQDIPDKVSPKYQWLRDSL